jgi:hypothetical protein
VGLGKADPSNLLVMPLSVAVPAGATTTTFTLRARAVTAPTRVTVWAAGGSVVTAALELLPGGSANTPSLASFSVTPSLDVTGGGTAAGAIILSGPAPAGGASVLLSSTHPALVVVPGQVTVREGATNATFEIQTRRVTVPTQVGLAATYGGVSRTVTLRVLPSPPLPPVVSFTVSPERVVGGTPVTGTVTLDAPAPPGGRGVGLASSNSSLVSVIETVIVPAGATRAQFTITTRPVDRPTRIEVRAAGGSIFTVVLELLPPAPAGSPSVASLRVNLSQVTGGESLLGSIALDGPAPAGGRPVGLGTNDKTAVSLPEQVVVPAGAREATFRIDTRAVARVKAVDIWAAGGRTLTTQLVVLPPVGLSLDPAAVQGGRQTKLTVRLPTPTPGEGGRVELFSSNPALLLPPSGLRLNGGALTTSFDLNTPRVTAATTIILTATYGGQAWSAVLTLRP